MTARPVSLAVFAFALMCLIGCHDEARPLPHEAYIWQRQWTPALVSAIEQSSDVMAGWRVLAAHSDNSGHIRSTSPDWSVLDRSGRQSIAVVRLEGERLGLEGETSVTEIAALVDRWRQNVRSLAGVEIDHDSATARLGEYSRFLRKLKAKLGPNTRLSITALPAWLAAKEFRSVLAEVDEAVLQVHAVNAPERGIFDRREAEEWVRQMAAITDKPFRVAVPAYGARLARRADGRSFAVESETPLLAGGASFEELTVSPNAIADFLGHLERKRPRNLTGIIWFRLPTSEDERSWSLGTLRAVIQGKPAKGQIVARVERNATPGMAILVLANPGAMDAPLPHRLDLPDDCSVGDGANGYRFERMGGIALLRSDHVVLREHRTIVVGWTRCGLKSENVHVLQ